MTWLNDVKNKRLQSEADENRRRLAARQAHEDSLRPLTPAVRAMVLQLLEDVGEAFWGAGKYFVKDEGSSWVLRSPPDGRSYSYWYLKFLPVKYRAWNFWPRFEVSYRKYNRAPSYTDEIRTSGLSERELKRVLKYAVSRGPIEANYDY